MKDWKVRLHETQAMIGSFVGPVAEGLVKSILDKMGDPSLQVVSKAMSLSFAITKKGSTANLERHKHRCIVLLDAVVAELEDQSIERCGPRFDTARKAAEKLKGQALDKRLHDAWEAVLKAGAKREELAAKAKADRLRAEQEKETKLCAEMAPLEVEMSADPKKLLAFMKTWSINPAPDTKGANDFTMIDVGPGDLARPMALRPSEKKPGALDLVYAKTGTTALGRMYFLPWGSRHITRIKLPVYTVGSPDVFFTSALSGCSVFVMGDPQAPTVFHAGVDGDVGDDPPPKGDLARHWKPYNAVEFWRQLLLTIVNKELTSGGRDALTLDGLKAQLGEVNKTDYVDDVTKPDVKFDEAQRRTTARSRAFVGAHGGKVVEVEVAAPSGTVFGLRDEKRAWSFYLQENLSVTYQKPGTLQPKYRVCIPIGIRQFFPPPKGEPYLHKAWDKMIDASKAFAKSGYKVR